MDSNFIPAFDWNSVIVQPWTEDFAFTGWILLMGFFVTAGCGLIGNYLLLRRMALVGDAISHSILPGLVVAFIIFKQSNTWVALIGAFIASIVTVALIEFIHKQSRIKPDAAICITFTSLFAMGVILMSMLESKGSIHIDAECILYGEIEYVALDPPVSWNGVELMPPAIMRMGVVLLILIALILAFYKELLLTSFDPELSRSLGLKTGLWHYGLMIGLAFTVVSAFESVGAILAVAMLIVPPMFAAQLSDRMPVRLCLTLVHAAISSILGLHLSLWLQCSTAGAMVVAATSLFILAWAGTAIRSAYARSKAVEQGTEEMRQA